MLSVKMMRCADAELCERRADGLSSVADDQFRTSFMDVYSSPSLAGIPWYAVSQGAYLPVFAMVSQRE